MTTQRDIERRLTAIEDDEPEEPQTLAEIIMVEAQESGE